MKYFSLAIIFSTLIYSQSLNGTVQDKLTGAKLSGVNISVEGTSRGTSTNSEGFYSLDISMLTAEQIVQFQHIGYDEKSVRIDLLDSAPSITLKPRVLQFDAIETAGKKRKPAIEKDLPQTVSIIQAEAFALRAYVDVGDLLATDQSIQIEESLSGRKTVSIRGGNSDDVLVLYNGFRLNRPYDNVFDLSLIDMQNIEQIEIVKGGHSVLYGSDAFSGVINIVPKNTKDKNLKFSQQFGSYASGFWNANGQIYIKNTFLSLNQKRGSYKRIFDDSLIDSPGLFSNLNHSAIDASTRIKRKNINGNLELNVTQDNQLFNNTRDQNRIESTNQLVGLKYDGILGAIGEVEISVGAHDLKEVQKLNNQNGYIDRDLDHKSNKLDVRKYINLNRIEWMFGLQAEQSVLKFWDDQNINNIEQLGLKGANLNRDQYGFATVLKIHSTGDKAGQWLTDLDVSFRSDKVKDYKTDLIFRVDPDENWFERYFPVLGENNWSNNIFKMSTIASKRSPGMTAAYWVTTGSNIKFPTLQQQVSLTQVSEENQSSLKLEKMKSLEIGINIINQPKNIPNIDQLEFQGSIFQNDFINKMRATYLLGMPVAFYENINLAKMTGIEGKLKAKTYNGRIIGEAGFSKYAVSDMSAFPFKSTFKLTIGSTVKLKSITFGTRWFQEGEQIGLIYVPNKGYNEIELPAFSNYDFHFTIDIKTGPIKGQFSYSGRNLKKNTTSLDGLLLRDSRKYITFSAEL